MANEQEPRVLTMLVPSCGGCPYCRFDGDYNIGYDAGWDCHHPHGGFRIVDEGDLRGPAGVLAKLGQEFPERCPLKPPSAVSLPVPVEPRTRSIQLTDSGDVHGPTGI